MKDNPTKKDKRVYSSNEIRYHAVKQLYFLISSLVQLPPEFLELKDGMCSCGQEAPVKGYRFCSSCLNGYHEQYTVLVTMLVSPEWRKETYGEDDEKGT